MEFPWIAAKENGKARTMDKEARRLARNLVMTSAVVTLDTDGVPTQTQIMLGESEARFKEVLNHLDEHMLMEIESLVVPIPNGPVRPLQSFRRNGMCAPACPGSCSAPKPTSNINFKASMNSRDVVSRRCSTSRVR